MLGYAIAAGATAAVVGAGYHTMAPRSQLYGRTFIGTRGTRQLALTFDDGPNDPHTLRLLEVLARHDVRATFFVLGKFVVERPDIVRDIARAGHAIGNHTYSHPNLIFCTRAAIAREIRECERAIAAALGGADPAPAPDPDDCHPERGPRTARQARLWPDASAVRVEGSAVAKGAHRVTLFRPPFGARRPGVLRVVRELGYVPVMWQVAGRDWKRRSAAEIEQAIARQVRGGEVILLHDGGHVRMGADRSRTVEATERLITRCKDAGYEFVTVPEMMARTP